MTRVLLGLPFAAVITGILFVLMWGMVRPGEVGVLPRVDPPVIDIFQKPIDPPAPIPQKPIDNEIKAPPPPAFEFTGPIGDPGKTIVVAPPQPRTFGPEGGVPTGTVLLPIAEIAPQYPARCAARGTEGFATVQYDVTADGQVVNARIIDRSHACFENAALSAIRNWRYQPFVGSEGYIARNVIKRFAFTLN